MTLISPSSAEKIVDEILSANDEETLAISLMDMKGRVLAAKSKESFKKAFGVTQDGDKYGGTLAVAALAVANEIKGIVGEAQAIIAIYEDCKMMLLPIQTYQVLVGLVLERSAVPDDYSLAKEVKTILAENVETPQ